MASRYGSIAAEGQQRLRWEPASLLIGLFSVASWLGMGWVVNWLLSM